MLSRNIKIMITLPVVLFGCEKWFVTLRGGDEGGERYLKIGY